MRRVLSAGTDTKVGSWIMPDSTIAALGVGIGAGSRATREGGKEGSWKGRNSHDAIHALADLPERLIPAEWGPCIMSCGHGTQKRPP